MQIWKFNIDPRVTPSKIPEGATILSVGMQGGYIMIWAIVDPEAPLVEHPFHVYGTGHHIALDHIDLPFVGTVFMDALVFHVFDGGEM